MSPKLFNFGRVLIIFAALCLALVILNFMGIINVKERFIQGLSLTPGLNDLAENYELGKKRSKLLSEREAELLAGEKQLQIDLAKLEEEKGLLLDEKLIWERKHPLSDKPTDSSRPSVSQKAALAKEEAKVKQYMATLGSMKPKKAAMVIQKLPVETVYLIFDQLQKSQVTRILENMPEEYLAKLTQDRLNQYRNL